MNSDKKSRLSTNFTGVRGSTAADSTAQASNSSRMAAMPLPQWFKGSDYTHRVARAITKYGSISRTTLAQILGLSQGALSRITSDLEYENVIEEAPESDSRPGKLPFDFHAKENGSKRGRPQTRLRLKAREHTVIGINIHDMEATAALADMTCRPVCPPISQPLASTDPETVASCVAAMVKQLTAALSATRSTTADNEHKTAATIQNNHHDAKAEKPVAIAVSIGGHIDHDRIITHAPFLHWDGAIDFAGMIEQRCGIPTAIFNDMDSLLNHESWFGRGVGLPRFAMLTIGSGVGYALCENGQPVDYPDKSYGLVGHILVDPNGPRCYAGHVGCSQCLTSDSLSQEYSTTIGRPADIHDIIADAQIGKPQVRLLINNLCFRLGALISTVANLTMPEKILIDGETSALAQLNTESIRSGIDWYRPSQASSVDFEILNFSWDNWALAAASRVIKRFIG